MGIQLGRNSKNQYLSIFCVCFEIYPGKVTTLFAKRTELDDYVGAAYKKVCKVHREEPKGGILVFVTGQDEVKRLVAKLKESARTKLLTNNINVAKIKFDVYFFKGLDYKKQKNVQIT